MFQNVDQLRSESHLDVQALFVGVLPSCLFGLLDVAVVAAAVAVVVVVVVVVVAGLLNDVVVG